MNASVGIKHDNTPDKNPWQLAPWDAFRSIVRVLGFGAKKYAPRNWELGIEYGRVYRAAIEHMSKWWLREDEGKGPGIDPETGFSHLAHAGCCVCFLIAYELRGVPNLDDRPDLQRSPAPDGEQPFSK